MNRKSFLTLVWVAFLISVIIFTFFTHEKSLRNAALTFGIALMYTLVIGMGNGLVNDFLSRKYSWVEQTRTRAILGIIGTILVNAGLVLFCNYVCYILILGKDPTLFFRGEMAISNWITINIAILVSAVLHAKSFMEEWKKSAKKEVVEQKLIAKSANAQFETLKNQLDPHFLFNSLNVLSALIDENPDQAQRFTSSMSKIYRYVLDQKDKELVTVQEEVDFANTYCELLKTRFEDSVSFDFQVDEKALSGFVVPLSLQLLLENCIKHNFATSSKPLNIRIFSGEGFLCVENNLQARETAKDREGIGLSNIVQRYSLITDLNVFIEKSEDDFKVKIPLLTEKINIMNTQQSNEKEVYKKATKRVQELKGFYGNLISYCIFIPFLIFINFYTSPKSHWFWWPLLGWGIGLIAHGVQTFGIGSDWEERQIRRYMQKEENNSNKWK